MVGRKSRLGRLPAAQLDDHRGGGFDPARQACRIHSAFESGASVRIDAMTAAGRGDPLRLEPGASRSARRSCSRRRPVLSPPITPPKPIAPLSSAMTQSSRVASYSLSLSARKRSPSAAAADGDPAVEPGDVVDVRGRARSMVKKLVMSTSAEIGLDPTAFSRRCSHSGLGPLRTPRITRPKKARHPDRSSIRIDTGQGKLPSITS